jgi:hypothetical protein
VVDMLARGASPYDVAKLLGDTVDTIEKHYAPFVRELRERARSIMEKWRRLGEGFWHDLGTVRAPEGRNAMKTKYIMAGKPVSRILFSALALTPARRSDHSSRSRFAPGLQQPTRGS